MAEDAYDFRGLDLTEDTYVVEQSLIRNAYVAKDADGEVVLRGKQRLFRAREQFPFTDAAGVDVFEVRAGGIVDVAGTYDLVDSLTDETVVVLDNDFSLLRDTWTVRDPETDEALVRVTSRGVLATLARHLLPLGGLLPRRYAITAPGGHRVGTIAGQLSLRDRYEVTLTDPGSVPREVTLAAAMVIDAIQGH